MELEEAINLLNNMRQTIKESQILFNEPVTVKIKEENTGLAIETVLQALKDKDEEIIKLNKIIDEEM